MVRFFLSLILILVIGSVIYNAQNISLLNSTIFFLIGLQSIYAMLFIGPSGHSMIKSIFFFNYIFFSLVPLIELEYSVIYWGGKGFEEIQYSWVGLLIFFANIFIIISYFFIYKFTANKASEISYHFRSEDKPINKLNSLHSLLILIFVLFLAFFIFSVHNFSIASLLLRGGELSQKNYEGTTALLLFEGFIRLLPFCVLIALVTTVRGSLGLKIFLFFIAILCVFPTAIARFRVPALYLSLAVFLFPWLLIQRRILITYLFGFIYIFPILDSFRYFSGTEDLSQRLDVSFVEKGHFDAFQNFVRLVFEYPITYGYQLLGVFLFWLPRSFWEDKPIGSGATLAEELSYSYVNISSAWLAEGWINFGFLGVIIFAILLGLLAASLDKEFWIKGMGLETSVYYIMFSGFILFLMRGDLLSGAAFLVGFALAQFIAFRLIRPFGIFK